MKTKFKVSIKKKSHLGTLKTLHCSDGTQETWALRHSGTCGTLAHEEDLGMQELELLVLSKCSWILGQSKHLSCRALKGHLDSQALKALE